MRTIIERLRDGSSCISREATRVTMAPAALAKRIAQSVPDFVIPKYTGGGGGRVLVQPTREALQLSEGCPRDGHNLEAGTDGNGGALLWGPDCDHTERVTRSHVR